MELTNFLNSFAYLFTSSLLGGGHLPPAFARLCSAYERRYIGTNLERLDKQVLLLREQKTCTAFEKSEAQVLFL